MSTPNQNQPTWQIESTHPALVELLKKGLQEIADPELGLNIIQLGLVRDVSISDQTVIIKMLLTTPFCPYGPAMLEDTRQKAESVLSMPTRIDYSMEPWDFSMMEEGLGGDWGLF